MKNFKRKYYKTLSVLTGIAVGFSIAAEIKGWLPDGDLFDSPILYPLAAIILIWIFSILTTFTYLLFSSKEREEAFLIVSNTEPRDELEAKALMDSCQSTFIFNILILSLVYFLSGFAADKSTVPETGKTELMIKFELPPNYKAITNKDEDNFNSKSFAIIPESFYSPTGLLALILLQFMSFRFFLFLNRRALE